MMRQGNGGGRLRSNGVRIATAVGVLSCAASYAQPAARMRSRQSDGVRLAQANEPRPAGRPLGRPGGPGGPGGPELQRPTARPRPWGEVPEPERRQIERFIEEHFPRMYVELQGLKDRDEIRYARRMTHIAPQMRQIMEDMRADPQRGALMIRERQLEFEIRQTVAEYRKAADDSARRRIRQHLEELCGKVFDCRSERRQMEVRELEARLSELQSRLSESEKMRPALIRQRASELLERPAPQPGGEEGPDGGVRPDGPESEPD